MPDTEWQEQTKNLLKAELKRRGVSYKQLAERLEAIGVHDTEANVKNKVSQGGFTAVFMLQCLEAIGAKELRLSWGVRLALLVKHSKIALSSSDTCLELRALVSDEYCQCPVSQIDWLAAAGQHSLAG